MLRHRRQGYFQEGRNGCRSNRRIVWVQPEGHREEWQRFACIAPLHSDRRVAKVIRRQSDPCIVRRGPCLVCQVRARLPRAKSPTTVSPSRMSQPCELLVGISLIGDPVLSFLGALPLGFSKGSGLRELLLLPLPLFLVFESFRSVDCSIYLRSSAVSSPGRSLRQRSASLRNEPWSKDASASS